VGAGGRASVRTRVRGTGREDMHKEGGVGRVEGQPNPRPGLLGVLTREALVDLLVGRHAGDGVAWSQQRGAPRRPRPRPRRRRGRGRGRGRGLGRGRGRGFLSSLGGTRTHRHRHARTRGHSAAVTGCSRPSAPRPRRRLPRSLLTENSGWKAAVAAAASTLARAFLYLFCASATRSRHAHTLAHTLARTPRRGEHTRTHKRAGARGRSVAQ
jgi:hypothetical protein